MPHSAPGPDAAPAAAPPSAAAPPLPTDGDAPRDAVAAAPSSLGASVAAGDGAPRVVSLDELAEWEDSLSQLQRKPSADEFARLVSEISTHRRRTGGVRAQGSVPSFRSIESLRSAAASDAWLRCCCASSECEAMQRVAQHVHELDMDLQLSAEIGQALLQRQDALVQRAQQEAEEHAQQRDQLLARLTQSIKETQTLQHQLTQAQLHLDAADLSQHALLSELEDARQQIQLLKAHKLKAASLETRLERTHTELEDTRAELGAERQRRVAAEKARARAHASADVRVPPRPLTLSATARTESEPPADEALQSMLDEHESLRAENERLKTLLRDADDQISRLQAEADEPFPPTPTLELDLAAATATSGPASPPSSLGMLGSSAPTPTPSTPATSLRVVSDGAWDAPWDERAAKPGAPTHAHGARAAPEQRTALLPSLMECVARAHTKLQQADIDTLSARLQRQRLAGDVAHLSRATIQASTRDMDGLKEHFRQLLDEERRHGVRSDGSLLTRRDFFALLKAQRETLLELARLRRCVNEIHLQPAAAARLLHEHLGANTLAPSKSWLSRLFTNVLSDAPAPAEGTPPLPPPVHESGFVRFSSGDAMPVVVPHMIERQRAPPPSRLLPRASPAVLSTSVAVHAHASPAASGVPQLLPKASQPALRAAAGRPGAPPDSRAPGNALPFWHSQTLRPRARVLSDSSMHTTFLEHGASDATHATAAAAAAASAAPAHDLDADAPPP